MQTGLVHLHSILRWVILILLIWSILKSYSGWKEKKPFSKSDAKVWLFTMIFAHVTLLLGIYQLLLGRYGILTTTRPDSSVPLMKDSFFRFFWIEHPFGMIVAITLITLGRGMAKKNVSDYKKYKKAFWYFLFALIIILVSIPWPFREAVGRPLFPGM